MRRAAVLLALLLLVPAHAAAAPEPRFPDAIRDLAPAWLAEAESVGAPHQGKEWYPQAQGFLDSATQAAAQGRVRSVLFDLETYLELVTAHALMEEAAARPSEAEGKSLILQRTGAWHQEALEDWKAYRDRLLDAQPDIRSLRGMEVAIYSADQALGARLLTDDREHLAREFPKQPGIELGYVMALVRSSRSAVQSIAWADDVLGAVSAYEGLPPRLNETAWTEMAAASLTPIEGNVPTHLQPLEAVAAEARERNESILALTVSLAEQRAARATSIFIIYGDATSRGKNVSADATAAMSKHLDNTSMDLPADYGLLGVFTADAIDRASKTRTVVETATLELSIIIAAWSALDHQLYVTNALAAMSPVRPEETPEGADAPLGALVPLAALAAGALLLARRR